MEEILYSIAKAANYLDCSISKIRKIDINDLHFSRTAGNHRRYKKSDLDKIEIKSVNYKIKSGFVSILEAANRLGIGIPTLRIWQEKGIIKGYRNKQNHRRC